MTLKHYKEISYAVNEMQSLHSDLNVRYWYPVLNIYDKNWYKKSWIGIFSAKLVII